MRGVFFYGAGVGFLCGVLTRSFFDTGVHGAVFLLVVGTALLLAYVVTRGTTLFLPALGIFMIACSLGMLRLERAELKVSALLPHVEKEVSLEGRIVREPEVRETMTHLHVRPAGLNELVLVTTDRFSGTSFRYGDTVVAEGTLKSPEAFETDGGRIFDYPGYLKARGVEHTLPFARVTLRERDDGSLIGSLYRGKQAFMNAVEAAIPEPESGLGEGVLLGVRRSLGTDLEQVFRETGIIHIVVLSGYNVMIVVSTFLYLLAFVFRPRTRLLLGIGAIVTFALLVGFSATVIRASVMAGLLLVAQTTGRMYAVVRALMLAGTGMLLINPYLIAHDPGFQLSFLATLGLIVLSPHIEKHLVAVPEIFGIRAFTTATVAAQVMVLPLLLYHTGLFSAVSVFVNVLVLPAVPIAMLLTFLTGIAGIVSHTLGLLFGFFAHLSLTYIIKVAELASSIPLASFSVPAFPFWLVFLGYGCIGYGVWRLAKAVPAVNDYGGWIIEEEKEIAKTPSGKAQ